MQGDCQLLSSVYRKSHGVSHNVLYANQCKPALLLQRALMRAGSGTLEHCDPSPCTWSGLGAALRAPERVVLTVYCGLRRADISFVRRCLDQQAGMTLIHLGASAATWSIRSLSTVRACVYRDSVDVSAAWLNGVNRRTLGLPVAARRAQAASLARSPLFRGR